MLKEGLYLPSMMIPIFINLGSKGKFRQFWRYNKFRHISMDGKERRSIWGMNEIQCQNISYAFFPFEIWEAKKSCFFSKATRDIYVFQIHMFWMKYDWIFILCLKQKNDAVTWSHWILNSDKKKEEFCPSEKFASHNNLESLES